MENQSAAEEVATQVPSTAEDVTSETNPAAKDAETQTYITGIILRDLRYSTEGAAHLQAGPSAEEEATQVPSNAEGAKTDTTSILKDAQTQTNLTGTNLRLQKAPPAEESEEEYQR
jgi:hypothetical protein